MGLFNKKDYIYNTLNEEKIDIALLQKVELDINIPPELLSSKNYKIEIEQVTSKARCPIAVKDTMKYRRRRDLEELNLGLIVIDVTCNKE